MLFIIAILTPLVTVGVEKAILWMDTKCCGPSYY